MDVNVSLKRTKNRKRKRHSKVKSREQARLEVRFAKRKKLVPERNATVLTSKEKLTNTMQANTFWENYEAAHEWQRRHSVEWWRSRCVALERENEILKEKIRELTSKSVRGRIDDTRFQQNRGGKSRNKKNSKLEDFQGYDREDDNFDNDNIEFQVDEEMMKFFEQSIRHKLELKEKRDVDLAAEKAELEQRDVPIEGGAAWMQAKTEAAKLLYGISSPRILAMETALQATMDRHKDRAKPQYWPNIPLNL